jgi:hypothetical protein
MPSSSLTTMRFKSMARALNPSAWLRHNTKRFGGGGRTQRACIATPETARTPPVCSGTTCRLCASSGVQTPGRCCTCHHGELTSPFIAAGRKRQGKGTKGQQHGDLPLTLLASVCVVQDAALNKCFAHVGIVDNGLRTGTSPCGGGTFGDAHCEASEASA